jgi:hypothetical protein
MGVCYSVAMSKNPKFNRPLIHDKEGFERYSSWFWGGLARKGGFTDGDAELHDDEQGRNRWLFIEAKPNLSTLTAGQKRAMQGKKRLDPDRVTALIVCIPSVDKPESVNNPDYVCHIKDEVHLYVVDHQQKWDDKPITMTLWEFNQRIRHWFGGNEFMDNPSRCGCGCVWNQQDCQEVLDRHYAGLTRAAAPAIV